LLDPEQEDMDKVVQVVPGLSTPEQTLNVDWSMLVLGLMLHLAAFVADFAHDIEEKEQP
jgi:hypothetical protein